jgi:hypothetical protein
MTVPTTADIVAGLMTENTGRHMMDSGDAYGRNFQAVQGMTTADFQARPAAYWSQGCGPTLDLFHFLADHVEYAPKMDRWLHIWAESDENARENWFTIAEGFAQHVDPKPEDSVRAPHNIWNTYNDDTLLSQGFQCVTFEYDDETYIALQVHGGCDIRGGYTQPRVFKVEDDWFYTVQDVQVTCTNPECDGGWEVRSHDILSGPDYCTTTDEMNDVWCTLDTPACPRCHQETLAVYTVEM